MRDLGPEQTEKRRADLAASFQRAIVDQLVVKLSRAARTGQWSAIALGGGVAANVELREPVTYTEMLALERDALAIATDSVARLRVGEGLPGLGVTTTWSKVSGPGTVTFPALRTSRARPEGVRRE